MEPEALPVHAFVTTGAEAGERLDRVLAARFPQVSRMRLAMAVETGSVRVEGELRPAGSRLAAGECVEVALDLEQVSAMTPEPIPVTVVYEDADLIVVEKPSGMVVHPAGRYRSGTLVNALAYRFNVEGAADPPIRPGIVHRLDRSTSGLMVVAKSQAALSHLTMQFQRKLVEKRYRALVHGDVRPDEGEWHAPIGQDPAATPKWGIREEGRPGHTRYRVERRLPGFSLLELEPVTGRTNQLRLHAAHFGHPIAGDDLFGRGALPGLDRLFLHAYRLELTHPVSREPLRFEIPLPAELEQFLAGLETP